MKVRARQLDSGRRSMLAQFVGLGMGLAGVERVAAQGIPPIIPPLRVPSRVPLTLISRPLAFDARYMGMSIGTSDISAGLQVAWARSLDQTPSWRDMNPSKGVYQDAGMGAWIAAMKALGARIMFTLIGTPTWASARPNEGVDAYGFPGGKAEPADPQDLADFMVWFLSQYGEDIDVIEIWNEPKYTYAGTPTLPVFASYFSGTPEALVRNIAKPIRDAVARYKPRIRVAGPACTGVTFDGPGSGIAYTDLFLKASDGEGKTGKDYLDILTLHTYVHDGFNTVSIVRQVQPLLAALKADNGIESMPVFATEYGFIEPLFTTYPGSAAQQATWIVNYAIRNRAAGVDVNIGYSSLAWKNDAGFTGTYNAWCAVLQGATMTLCRPVVATNDLDCVFDGVAYRVQGPPLAL